MGILGGKFTNDDDDGGGGGDGLALDLDLADKVCPVCGMVLAPWADQCPADGATPVAQEDDTPDGPAVPEHLLDGLGDQPAPGGADGDGETGTGGAGSVT